MSRKSLLLTAIRSLVAVAIGLDGASLISADEKRPTPVPNFETQILPILQAKCVRCHGNETKKSSLGLSSQQEILKGGESGKVLVPWVLKQSLLYQKVADGEMPPDDRDRLTKAQLATLRLWIEAGAPFTTNSAVSDRPQVTQHDVVPILLRHCIVCHGLQRQEGRLDLRSKTAMLKGGKSGPAIVLGRPDESLVIKRIRSGQMPPKENLLNTGTRPIRESDVPRLAQWIALGAPEVDVEADLAGTPDDPLVDESNRKFWAFRAPQAVRTPDVAVPDSHQPQDSVIRNPIDAFVVRKLQQAGLTFAPPADRLTLLRRACFDLTGLPPDPREIEAFLADTRPDSYGRLIDRLLASPRYGERWGRYWLDAVGYADSWGGKLNADHRRPHAWRYRDYVIRSLNADKPYDRFLLEQIAGDELVDYENAEVITQEIYDNLVATGFLRMAPDSTSEREVSFVSDRVDVMADEIDVFSSTVLGLTVKCARCHSHKYDPIPQRDYYRLTAVFKGAYDEYDWLKPVNGTEKEFKFDVRVLPHVTTVERNHYQQHNAKLDREIDLLRHDLNQKAAELKLKYINQRLAKLPTALQDELRLLLQTEMDQRNDAQKQLAAQHEKELQIGFDELKELDARFKQQSGRVDKAVKELQTKTLPQPGIQALWDRGTPSPTYLYQRGDHDNPGRLVTPGVPAVLTDGKIALPVKPPWPGAKQTGRRLALARWVTRRGHPLTARVMVNRIWKHHFGSGIVTTVGNFGQTGARPSHPELLDWLAVEFVRKGWSLKAVHRLMMTSTTYQQGSSIAEVGMRIEDHPASVDPRSEPPASQSPTPQSLFSPMPMKRMEAEVLRDSLLFVAGRLNEMQFGRPNSVQSRPDGLVTSIETANGWRRSVYVQQRRTEILTILDTFDLPQMNPNCLDRPVSTVAPQALHLMNNAMIDKLAGYLAHRVRKETGSNLSRQVETVYLIALSRPPEVRERRIGEEALRQLTEFWKEHLARQNSEQDFNPAEQALATYCHAILNSASFLYID